LRASDHTGVAIPHKKATFLVRKPGFPAKTGRSPHQPSGWFAMTLFFDSLKPGVPLHGGTPGAQIKERAGLS